jgi:hypothetical protein
VRLVGYLKNKSVTMQHDNVNVKFKKTTALKMTETSRRPSERQKILSTFPSYVMIQRSWLIFNDFLLRILQGVRGKTTSKVSAEIDCLICVPCRLSPSLPIV